MIKLEKIADKALNELKKAGADIAQCSVKRCETREFNVDCNEFSLYRTLFDNSLTMTAFTENKKGAVNINHFDDASIEKAAADCVDVARSGNPDEAWEICSEKNELEFESGVYEPDMDRFFARTKELFETVRKNHPSVSIEQMIAMHTKEDVLYRNSNGVKYTVKRGEYALMLMYSAHDGELSSSFASIAFAAGDLDTPFYELSTIRKDLTDIEKQVHTQPITGKFTCTVLATPGCVEELVMTAMDNFAGEGALIDGTSIWKNKLGKKVADSKLTIAFAPHDSRVVCGERYTADGYVSKDYDIIKDGVLNSFMLTAYGANKLGLKRSENTSSSMVIDAGNKSVDDIIASIDKGIIIGRFSGGHPAGNGEFSGIAKNSFLIENGKITCALSETMVSGNLADMLANIEAISKEVVSDGNSCIPYIAFSGVTVSGQ